MTEFFKIAWQRFNIIMAVVSDANARFISLVFYFSILVPFGIGSTLFSDPLRRKMVRDDKGSKQHAGLSWLEREPTPTDIDSAKLQG